MFTNNIYISTVCYQTVDFFNVTTTSSLCQS